MIAQDKIQHLESLNDFFEIHTAKVLRDILPKICLNSQARF
jgi:hypothetical protein